MCKEDSIFIATISFLRESGLKISSVCANAIKPDKKGKLQKISLNIIIKKKKKSKVKNQISKYKSYLAEHRLYLMCGMRAE